VLTCEHKGNGSGIAFNIAEDWSELYTLEIYPDMWYGLYHYYPGGMDILEERYSNALRNFTTSNHISIRQHLDTISAYANGELLTNVAYEPITPGEKFGNWFFIHG
jgi:hypothetical protein